MRALHGLGVAAAVEKAGTVIHRFRYFDRAGTPLCDIDLDHLWGDVGPFVEITRAALHKALLSESARSGMGRAASSVRQHGGRVSVTFDDGTADVYDLVIGADGINSGVRLSAVSRSRPAYAGQMVWRSVAPVWPEGLDGVQFWLGRDRFFGLCPVGDGITYGFGNVARARAQAPWPGAGAGSRHTSPASAHLCRSTWPESGATATFTVPRSSGCRRPPGAAAGSCSSATPPTRCRR